MLKLKIKSVRPRNTVKYKYTGGLCRLKSHLREICHVSQQGTH